MKKVLFVCTGNTCRSPMAQGICEKMAEERDLPISCESAGLSTVSGHPVSTNAITVCQELGVDISRYRTKNVRELELSDYDAIFTMSPRHKHALIALGANPYKIWLLGAETGGISDPYGGDEDTYRRCRDEIYDAINDSIKEI
ncbi:MAG: low molecular weight phosphatase family protein [Ruminococcus sp.]|jgi:protein-tyrosine phosphatase|nr:low molecular weight phosphatase family protein [Ruminococcus sp.]